MRSWLLALLLCAPCAALPYDQVPSPRPGGWVTDQAHMLDPSTLGRINHMLDQLQRSTQTECALVTVDSAGAMNPKTYATALFNRWGIGRAGHNDGALMIVFARDRRVEIETGESARRQLTDDEAARLLRTEVVPRMRQNQPAQALEAGINSMLHELDPAAPAAVPPPPPRRPPFPPEQPKGALHYLLAACLFLIFSPFLLLATMMFWLPPLLVAYALGWGPDLRDVFSATRCAECNKKMKTVRGSRRRRLLSADQADEEKAGGVLYRLLQCSGCGRLDSKPEPFSNLRRTVYECPKCHLRLGKVARQEIQQASTYNRGGLATDHAACLRCGLEWTHQVNLPMLVAAASSSSSDWSSSGGSSSSGDSGGGFSGGSSDGGGSGASW